MNTQAPKAEAPAPQQQQQSQQVSVIGQICKSIDAMKPGLSERLTGTGVAVDRFIGVAKTVIQMHNDREKLERADRNSLFTAIQLCASDGLVPDNREAALVVYGQTVQYQPMVQGLIKLARNSGEVGAIDAFVVHKNDTFKYRQGIDVMPEHDAPWFGERGEALGVWAFFKLKGGDTRVIMLPKERVMRIAQRSKMQKSYKPGEGLDWEEFWKKAAIRNVLKMAPRSKALDHALEKDNDEFEGLTDGEIPPAVQQPKPVDPVITDKPKTETRAAQAVKGATTKPKATAPTQDAPPPVKDKIPDADFTDGDPRDHGDQDQQQQGQGEPAATGGTVADDDEIPV